VIVSVMVIEGVFDGGGLCVGGLYIKVYMHFF